MKMALPREKFSSQLEAALREYLERQETGKPRKVVIEAFAKSIAEFDLLYKELAK
jgi:hypothetical protein